VTEFVHTSQCLNRLTYLRSPLRPAVSWMLHLSSVRTTFRITSPTGKKPGTTVDITFRKCEDGDVLAMTLNAGMHEAWNPGSVSVIHLQLVNPNVHESELQKLCVRLSWFPERDESIRYDLSTLIHFDNGASIDRSFPNQQLSESEAAKQLTVGLY